MSPSSSMSTDQHAARAARTARRLRNGAWLALASILAGVLAFIAVGVAGLASNTAWLIVSIAAGAPQLYLAARTQFDAAIFRRWANQWKTGADPHADMAAFDRKIGRNTDPPRSLDARIEGATRLFRYQSVMLLVQLVASALAFLLP